VVGLEWYPCCRLKHNWSVHVECDIKLVYYSSTITMMHGPINIRIYVDIRFGRFCTKLCIVSAIESFAK